MTDIIQHPPEHAVDTIGDCAHAPWGETWTHPFAEVWIRQVGNVTLTVSLARDVWYLVVTGDVHYPGIRLPGVRDAKEARERAVAELKGRLMKIAEGLT